MSSLNFIPRWLPPRGILFSFAEIRNINLNNNRAVTKHPAGDTGVNVSVHITKRFVTGDEGPFSNPSRQKPGHAIPHVSRRVTVGSNFVKDCQFFSL